MSALKTEVRLIEIDALFSRVETMALLGDISRATLWRYERKGFITSYPSGRINLFPASEIQRCINHIKAGDAIVLDDKEPIRRRKQMCLVRSK